MKNLVLLLTISICCISQSSFGQAPLVNYTYWDTVRYSDANFTASETFISDIADDGLMIGYFRNAQNEYEGFVYNFVEKKFHTYKYSGYTHTELTGINSSGKVIGRAYTSPTSAIAIMGDIINDSIQNVVQTAWFTSGATSKWPMKINNNNIGAGSVYTGTTRWMQMQSMPTLTFSATERYETTGPSPIQYNTYGRGVNDLMTVCGYYLDGSEYVPCVWDSTQAQFYIYPHKVAPPAVGLPRTIINDINNDGFMAVDYRDSNNIMQGTIAKVWPTSLTLITYETDANFIFNKWESASGSSISGINNKNDIVGQLTLFGGDKLGFYAISDQSSYQIPTLNPAQDVFKIMNAGLYHEYDYGYYNYASGDIWLNQVNNFDQLVRTATIVNNFKHYGYVDGTKAPSWKAWVHAQEEDSCYINTPQGLKPRSASLSQWFMSSPETFQGLCFGTAAFYLQQLKDRFVIDSRFSLGVFTSPNTVDYDSLPSGINLKLTEILHSLHLYQRSNHMAKFNTKEANYSKNLATIWDSIKIDFKSMVKGIQSIDSVQVLGIRYKGNEKHAVVVVKVARAFSMKSWENGDTLYIMDPNIPNSFPTISIDNTNELIIQKSWIPWLSTYKLDTLKYFLPIGNLNDIQVAGRALLPQKPESTTPFSSTTSNKTYNGESRFFLNQVCDYKLEDVSNSSNFYQKSNGVDNNQFAAVEPYLNMNDDDLADELIVPSGVSLKTTLNGGCDSVLNWMMAYPEGDMLFARRGTLPNQQDIIFNNQNILKVQNPDNVNKFVRLGAIYGPGDEESFVSIDSFKLKQNDTVRYTAIDQYNFKITNGKNATNGYNLYVRFLSPSEYFIWQTKTIVMHPKTDHIIHLRPTMAGNEVVILVDSLQDGIIDDTLTIANSGLHVEEVIKNTYDFQIYPNPAKNQLTVSLNNLPPNDYTLTFYNAVGQIVYSEIQQVEVGKYHTKINSGDWPNGFYYLQLSSPALGIPISEKIIIQQ